MIICRQASLLLKYQLCPSFLIDSSSYKLCTVTKEPSSHTTTNWVRNNRGENEGTTAVLLHFHGVNCSYNSRECLYLCTPFVFVLLYSLFPFCNTFVPSFHLSSYSTSVLMSQLLRKWFRPQRTAEAQKDEQQDRPTSTPLW